MKFKIVTDIFERIEQVSSRLEITDLLAQLFKQATPHEASIIANVSLGQLEPPYIGTQFNLAEKSLLPIVGQLLNKTSAEVKTQARKLGDIGAVIATGDWQPTDELTVTQVYDALKKIESISGTGSQELKAQELKKLLKKLDPQSAKYVIRIVAGKLRLGFSDMTIVDALSWMEVGDKSLRKSIENAFNMCADIGYIAQVLKKDGIQAIKNMHINIGIPIRPSAAERLPHARAIIEKIGTCIAQPKLDGFRLQIHVDKTKAKPIIHFYSRNLQDMSYMFPDVKKAMQNLDVQTMICEGEAIVFDSHTNSFLPFQQTVKRKRKHGIEKAAQELPLKIFLFDLLYLNGKEYLSVGHEERRKALKKVVEQLNNPDVVLIEEKYFDNAKDLEEYFLHNISAGLEGLVVKRPDAMYQPGKRNFNWIKLKRHEQGELEDTIDCVILGYYLGKGRRVHFGIGAFLVGVFNKEHDRFETVAKIGTGRTDEQWKELKKKCDEFATKEQPHNVVCNKDLIPDVWVTPEIVCVVRADEITQSPVHAAGKTKNQLGYALRFPRIMGYREDKGPFEATTAEEIKRLYQDQYK